ncbi:MAG: PAS domain S-box protein, partial [Clostridiales bacterium]
MFRDSFHDNKILETVVFPILDSSEIGISIINKEGSILEVNDAFCKLFGFEREEILYKHFSSIIIEENMEYSLKQHHEFMDNGYYDKREVLLKQKNGRFFFAKVTDIKFNDGEGNLYRTTSFLNITEKKQSELIKSILDKLPQEAESGESLESMFRMIHAAAEQLMPAYNFYAAFSNPLNETIEYPYFVNEFCGEDEYREGAAACDELTRYIIQNKRSVLLNEEQLSKFFPVKNNVYNGLAPRSVVGSVLKIKNSVVGAIFLQDFHENNAFSEKHINIIKHLADKISIMLERRNYEEQLIITKEKAEESNRVKTAFLAQMSHEIRTPINTILSFTSLLKEKCEGLLEEELKESFNIIEKGGRRLVRTIDLILNMSQLQSDCFEINPAQIDM